MRDGYGVPVDMWYDWAWADRAWRESICEKCGDLVPEDAIVRLTGGVRWCRWCYRRAEREAREAWNE